MQKGFEQPGRPALNAIPDGPALRLLEAWRARGGAVIHVRHDSIEPLSVFAPSHPGNALRDGFAPEPGEGLIVKSVNSAFIGTDLDLRLRRLGTEAIVALGMSTDMCLSTTVRMGANLGYRMIVAAEPARPSISQGWTAC
jgi:nicotinamidase-related amidase